MILPRWILALLVFTFGSGSVYAQFDGTPNHSFLWNKFESVVVVDSFAIGSISDGLLVLALDEATQTYSPVNQLNLPAPPSRYKRSNDLILFSSDVGLLYFIDASALPDISLLGQASLPIEYSDFAVHGNDLYIAAGFQGLWRYNLNDYDNPTFVDSSMLGIHCTQVEVQGDSLYALDDLNGILRYDISGGGFGVFVDNLDVPFQVSGFNVHDSTLTLLLANRNKILLATMGSGPPRIDTEIGTLGIPEQVMTIDSFVVLLDHKIRLIELYARGGKVTARRIYLAPLHNDFFGDVFLNSGVAQLLLPNFNGGFSRFNLHEIGPDVQAAGAYRRTGPITGIVGSGSRLLTAGLGNPLESFSFDADGKAISDTVYVSGIAGVRSIATSGDRIYAYYAPLNRISVFRPTADSLVPLLDLPVDTSNTFEMRVPESRPDADPLLLTWRGSRLTVFTFGGVSDPVFATELGVLGNIADVVMIDSIMVIATNKRNFIFYRVFDDLRLEFRAQIGSIVRATHLQLVKSTGCSPRLLAFGDGQMISINTDDFFAPFVDSTSALPISVSNSVMRDSLLYTVGESGIGLFALSNGCGLPTLLDYGGRPGHLIALVGPYLAVSDGGAVHTYKNDSGVITEVGGIRGTLPREYQLTNFPNPFNPETTIRYQIPVGADISLTVYNLLGQPVRTFFEGFQTAGEHTIVWNGRNDQGREAASGVYLYRMIAGDHEETRKMVLIK